MKKKFVNVVLSAAVVTSMMFGMTACGSKDTTPAPAEDAAVTNTVAADTEPAAEIILNLIIIYKSQYKFIVIR